MNPSSSDWSSARGQKWYDKLAGTEPMLAPVDAPLLEALQLRDPLRIADVGCGGGTTTLEILRRAPAGSVVHGYDISPVLVEAARARELPEGVTFEVADVAKVQPRVLYDRLASRFGVMFFDDPPAAFANLARWLAPGGRLAFAVWGDLAQNPWVTTVREAVAQVAEVPRPDPDAPGPFRYAEVDKLLSLLGQAGLDELEARDWRGQLPVGGQQSPSEAARFALAAFSAFDELLAAAGPAARSEAERLLTERFAPHHRDGAVWMDAHVRIVTGKR